jgi:RNA polymerase sigma factor (sigma-70 family)
MFCDTSKNELAAWHTFMMKSEDHGQILEPHRKRLFYLAQAVLGSAAEAEDAVQETFLKYLTRAPHDLRSIEAWLVTVVRNVAIDQFRRRCRDLIGGEGSSPDKDFESSLWVTAMSAEDNCAAERNIDAAVALRMMIARLGKHEVAALLLREVFDADYAEIAEVLGKQEAACRQWLHRALIRARDANPNPNPNPYRRRREMPGTDEHSEVFFLHCWRALASRDASMLYAVLARPQTICVAASTAAVDTDMAGQSAKTAASVSLRWLNGHLALVYTLGDVVLCAVPVGACFSNPVEPAGRHSQHC